jgi:hypothetical protein
MDMFFIFQSGICFIIFIVIAIILSIMLRNRLYFTYVARQLNAIRNFLLEKDAPRFRDNQMYRKTDLSALNFMSTQTLMMIAVAFISALYFSASIYSYSIVMQNIYDFDRAAWFGVFIFAVEMITSSVYLLLKNKKTAD